MTAFTENKIVINLKNPIKTRIFHILGILLCCVLNLFYYTFRSVGERAGWIMIVIGTYLAISLFLILLMHLFLTPQKIIIDGDTISFDMLFRKRRKFNIIEIEKIKYSTLLSFKVDNSGWLICANSNQRYMITEQFFTNFHDLIDAIKSRNPKCLIDENVLNWKGPRYSI